MRCHAGKPLNIRSLRFPEDITRVNWNNESGRGNADNQSNPGCFSKPVNSLDRARHFIAFPQDPGTCVDPVLLSSGAGHSARQKQEEREWERERENAPSQLPTVFTAARHQTFIRCHLYSLWCEAISISQPVKWCRNRLLPGSVKKEKKNKNLKHTHTHKHTCRFSFLVQTTDRWSMLIC